MSLSLLMRLFTLINATASSPSLLLKLAEILPFVFVNMSGTETKENGSGSFAGYALCSDLHHVDEY